MAKSNNTSGGSSPRPMVARGEKPKSTSTLKGMGGSKGAKKSTFGQ